MWPNTKGWEYRSLGSWDFQANKKKICTLALHFFLSNVSALGSLFPALQPSNSRAKQEWSNTKLIVSIMQPFFWDLLWCWDGIIQCQKFCFIFCICWAFLNSNCRCTFESLTVCQMLHKGLSTPVCFFLSLIRQASKWCEKHFSLLLLLMQIRCLGTKRSSSPKRNILCWSLWQKCCLCCPEHRKKAFKQRRFSVRCCVLKLVSWRSVKISSSGSQLIGMQLNSWGFWSFNENLTKRACLREILEVWKKLL